jgi:hypothetical protein
MAATSVRPVFRLLNQAMGLQRDACRLTVVQHWSGFSADRHALCISVNDAVTTKRAQSASAVRAQFAEIMDMLVPFPITEDQARDWLADNGRPRYRHCTGCAAQLPLGGLYCTRCGLPGTVPIGGDPTPARPLADVVPLGAGRKQPPADN